MTSHSARALYRSMHAGLVPRVRTMPAPRTPRALIDLRRMTAFEGTQLMGKGRVQGSGSILYRHEFDEGTGPMVQRIVGRDSQNMFLSGGRYRINDEGMVEDMAKKRHHGIKRYMNPESDLAFLVLIGLALAAAGIVNELIQALLPARWSHRTKAIGVDALFILAGVGVYKRSKVWGIGLAGAGVADATAMAWVGLGLDEKVRRVFHLPVGGAGSGVRTIASVAQFENATANTDGSFAVTYSSGSGPAMLPAGTSPAPVTGGYRVTYSDGSVGILPSGTAPVVGASGRIFRQLDAPRIEGGWTRPGQRTRSAAA
jgi:hypothetical protein